MKLKFSWLLTLALALSCTGVMASAQDRDHDDKDRDHQVDRDHDRDHDRDKDRDRWETRNGWDYGRYEGDRRPMGWMEGQRTEARNCEMANGRHYDCYSYTYEGNPYYYYRDENGRMYVRRHHGDHDRDRDHDRDHDHDNDHH